MTPREPELNPGAHCVLVNVLKSELALKKIQGIPLRIEVGTTPTQRGQLPAVQVRIRVPGLADDPEARTLLQTVGQKFLDELEHGRLGFPRIEGMNRNLGARFVQTTIGPDYRAIDFEPTHRPGRAQTRPNHAALAQNIADMLKLALPHLRQDISHEV